jgi:hypothetical protein
MEKDLSKDFLPKIIMVHWVDKSRVGKVFFAHPRFWWEKKTLPTLQMTNQ